MNIKNNQKGSLHLAAIGAVLVIAGIAAIGVKVLNQSQAATLRSSLITITLPAANANVDGYQEVVAKVGGERNIKKVVFFANGTLISNVGTEKCFPAGQPQPSLVPRSFLTCWDSIKTLGSVKLTAKVTFGNGDVAVSAPVTVNVLHGDPAPFTVSITNPVSGAKVAGYIPVFVTTSTTATNVTLSANGTIVNGVEISKCYSDVVPSPAPNTTITCFNSSDEAFANVGKISFVAKAQSVAATPTSPVFTATSAPVVVYHEVVIIDPAPMVTTQ